MTVADCQNSMTWNEFLHWTWLYEYKPFGELALDLRFADLMIHNGNIHSEEKDRQEPVYIGKFGGTSDGSSGSSRMVARDAEQAGMMLAALAGGKPIE